MYPIVSPQQLVMAQLKTLYLPPMLIQSLIENAILHGLIADKQTDSHLAEEITKPTWTYALA